MLKVNDFFCGCGGVGVGFQKAGYEVVWACDYDKYAVQSYRHNVGDHVIQADIKTLTHKDIPKADVWAFGFPCQDLSVAGRQKGFILKCESCEHEWEVNQTEDVKCPECGGTNYKATTRSAMFFEIMRLLEETEKNDPDALPQALLAENVKGLQKYIPILENEFAKRGYKAYIQLYNSKYWGVAQNRERYFIVGLRERGRETVFAFPREQHEYVPKLSEFLDDNVDEKYYIPDEKAQKIIQQALEKLQELGKVHATITPDRLNKRQNCPRAKEDEKEMFTLTAQDIHGVIVQRPRGKNAGGVHEIAPTLTSHAYQQNNFVVENTTATEADVCAETGLLDPNGCGKTLRVGGGTL